MRKYAQVIIVPISEPTIYKEFLEAYFPAHFLHFSAHRQAPSPTHLPGVSDLHRRGEVPLRQSFAAHQNKEAVFVKRKFRDNCHCMQDSFVDKVMVRKRGIRFFYFEASKGVRD